MLKSAQNYKKCTFLVNLTTITWKETWKLDKWNHFFHYFFSSNYNIHSCIWKWSKFISCGPPFGPFWSVKYLNLGKKLLIWTAHHTFLESRHPEFTKNSYYVLSSQEIQKKYQFMDYLAYLVASLIVQNLKTNSYDSVSGLNGLFFFFFFPRKTITRSLIYLLASLILENIQKNLSSRSRITNMYRFWNQNGPFATNLIFHFILLIECIFYFFFFFFWKWLFFRLEKEVLNAS